MKLLPAIDLRDGRCVRLLYGDFTQETRYAVDPVELAVQYRDLGARWLHVVDLDGAKQGSPVNLPLIRRMRDAAAVDVQLGATWGEARRTSRLAVLGLGLDAAALEAGFLSCAAERAGASQ